MYGNDQSQNVNEPSRNAKEKAEKNDKNKGKVLKRKKNPGTRAYIVNYYFTTSEEFKVFIFNTLQYTITKTYISTFHSISWSASFLFSARS